MKQDKSIPDVLTTQQAAKMLGLSVSSVQKMVISGALSAWVTPGGHRRILRATVEALTSLRSQAAAPEPRVVHSKMRVLLAEDDPIQVQFIRTLLDRSEHAIDLIVATDGSMALIQLERQRPDLVITDLMMRPFDGFHLIRTLEQEPAYFPIDVVVMSALDLAEAQSRGHLPQWVTYYQKPVHAERLLGYLDAMQTRVIKRNDSALSAQSVMKV